MNFNKKFINYQQTLNSEPIKLYITTVTEHGKEWYYHPITGELEANEVR